MTTVHLVYPHGPRISTPHSIGRKIGEHMRGRYEVVHHDIDELTAITPGPDAALIGHPHPAPWTVFRRSARRPGWKRVIMLLPYNHGDNVQVAFADAVIRRCDLYLAITGITWFSSVSASLFSHWQPKMVHLDLAVDRADFPPRKARFGAPGRRRFLYIGHTAWFKNTPYLSELARRLPSVEFAWIGAGDELPGVKALGRHDFSADPARQLVSTYDFMITVGSADCNPTTILEAMAWGLIPVCTPESGYAGFPGIVNVPLGDPERAVEILEELQTLPEERLLEMQAANREALDSHFNFDRFMDQVFSAIESDASPPLGPAPLARTLRIRWHALRSPYSWLRPRNLRFVVRSLLLASPPGRALLARRRRRWAESHGQT